MSEEFDYDDEALREANERRKETIRQIQEEANYAEAFEDTEDDDEEDDDEDEQPRGVALEVMTPTQFNEHRLEAWKMAYVALVQDNGKPRDWGDGAEKYIVDPADVLLLARFIEGDELSE